MGVEIFTSQIQSNSTSHHRHQQPIRNQEDEMRPSVVQYLLRPWKKYKDGTPFKASIDKGTRRWQLTTKDGKRDMYKGTGSSGVGRWSRKGRYLIAWNKVRTYVVPRGLEATDLKPLVCVTAPPICHTFKGYDKGAVDGKLYVQKIKEFIEYGTNEAPDSLRDDSFTERG